MIRALASLRRNDGTYPEVGMTDRIVIDEPTVKKARSAALRWADSASRNVRIEYHNGSLLLPPFLTEHW